MYNVLRKKKINRRGYLGRNYWTVLAKILSWRGRSRKMSAISRWWRWWW